MKPIFDDKGRMIDISDEGEQARQIEDNIDIHFALMRLKPKKKKIAELILEGYNLMEISKKLDIPYRTVKYNFSQMKKKLPLLSSKCV